MEALSDAYREANREAIRLSAAFTPLIRMAILVGFTATLLLGGWFTLEGTMAVGAYSVLVFMTQRLLWPLTRLGETFDLYQRAMASSTRVLDVLASPIELQQGEYSTDGETRRTSSIALEGVSFGYPDREMLFNDLSLTFEHGKTTGVVGSTGAGKTSLVRLLSALLNRKAATSPGATNPSRHGSFTHFVRPLPWLTSTSRCSPPRSWKTFATDDPMQPTRR